MYQSYNFYNFTDVKLIYALILVYNVKIVYGVHTSR